MENKRLTEKLRNGSYICGIIKGGFVDKLGQLEDLMEKYDIESVEELENILKDRSKK